MQRRRVLGWMCAAALAPGAAWAQSREKTYWLGILAPVAAPYLTEPLYAALSRRGWSVGKNLQVELRITAGDAARALELARELLAERVDVIITITTGNAVAAKKVTSTVPIVMLGSGYPVEAGLAESLARPGGNVTGVSVYAGTEMWGKYVSLARELVPGLRELGVFFDYVASDSELAPLQAELRAAAKALNVGLRFWRNRTDRDLDLSFAEIEKSLVGAILVTGGPLHSQPANVARINELARRRRLPMINDLATNVFHGGGLLAYSFTPQELAERCANMIDRILRGASPRDLPIEYPTRFELTINMKAAAALGLTPPQSLLLRADHLVR